MNTIFQYRVVTSTIWSLSSIFLQMQYKEGNVRWEI
jgi:hypothetical protein